MTIVDVGRQLGLESTKLTSAYLSLFGPFTCYSKLNYGTGKGNLDVSKHLAFYLR